MTGPFDGAPTIGNINDGSMPPHHRDALFAVMHAMGERELDAIPMGSVLFIVTNRREHRGAVVRPLELPQIAFRAVYEAWRLASVQKITPDQAIVALVTDEDAPRISTGLLERRSPAPSLPSTPSGLVPLAADPVDLEMMARWGFRRADTKRLRDLLAAGRAQLASITRARRGATRPMEGLALCMQFRRSKKAPHGWRIDRIFDAEAGEPANLEGPPNKIGLVGADVVQMVGGSATPEEIAGDCIRLSAGDTSERTLSWDHVVLVGPDGALGELRPSLPSIYAEGSAS